MTFDLIIPCFNPPIGWEKKLVLALAEFRREDEKIFRCMDQIIVVNDGSTRQVTTTALSFLKNSGLPFKILHNPENRGKGYSIRQGVRLSNADLCIYTDLDLPFGSDGLKAVLNALEIGADIAIGKRSKRSYYQNAPLLRKCLSAGLMLLNRYVLALPFEDTQAGIKGFNRFGKAIFLQTRIKRFLFDLEFIQLALDYSDLQITEVSVKSRNDLALSRFNLNIMLRETGNFLLILIKRKYVLRAKKHLVWD